MNALQYHIFAVRNDIKDVKWLTDPLTKLPRWSGLWLVRRRHPITAANLTVDGEQERVIINDHAVIASDRER
jgi:hypothetical protein